MTTIAAIQRIIANETDLKVEDLDPARPLEDLGVDSLTVIEVMFQLETEFKVLMPEAQVPIRTVQDIANLVDHLVAEQQIGLNTA